MRQPMLRLFIPLWLALCLLGCGKPAPSSYPPTMVEAARLSEHEAARALPLLEALADSLDRLDEEGRVYYDLLRLRVNDKLNVRATSDTLIRRITAFYEAYGDPDKLMLAYYYRGRVCADLNDALQALHFYRKAVEVSGGKRQYLLLSRIYSQMGGIYEYQNIYEEAIPFYRKAYEYKLFSGDSVTLSMPLRDIAGAYYELGQMDSALAYYQKAYAIALETRNRKRELGILVEMSAIYRDRGNMEKAFELLYPSLRDSVGRNMNPTYYSLGKLYWLMGKNDSAFYWMSRVQLGDDIYIQSEIYSYLARIEKNRNNIYRSNLYYEFYRQCQDSIVKIDQSEEIRRMKSLYDYNLRERENQRLALANERKQASIYRLFAITSILLLLLCGGLIHYLNRRRAWQRQTRKLEAEKRRIYRESEERIKDNLQKIAELEAQSGEEARAASAGEPDLVALNRDILSAENRHIELSLERRRVLEERLITSAIYARFHDETSRITETDWASLIHELDQIYDLTNRLRLLSPNLSEIELRICYLVKIHVKVTDMAAILCRSVSGVSSIRNRLYAKLTGERGSTEKLDRIILDL